MTETTSPAALGLGLLLVELEKIWQKSVAIAEADEWRSTPCYFGTTAVASISTLASSSTRAATCTSVMVGKCLPITSR